MESQTLRRASSTAAVVTGLVLSPGILGYLVAVFPALLSGLMTGLYAARLEFLPLVVTPLVVLIVVYAFLSRGRRTAVGKASRPEPGGWRRKLLPPVELALLGIGNLTFGAFALILAVLTLAFLFSLLRNVIVQWPLLARSFTASLAFVALVLVFAWRPRVLKALSWSRLRGSWIMGSGRIALAVGVLGIVGATGSVRWLGVPTTRSLLDAQTLAILYLGFLACLLASHLLARGGRARAPREESAMPRGWFLPAFGLIWFAKLGILALYTHAVLLTLHARLIPG